MRGAKAILDLPATLEVLETQGVPVIGYGVSEFPAFYSTTSGLKLECRVDSPEEAAEVARAHWAAGLKSAVLVVNPPPPADAIPPETVEAWILRAEKDAHLAGITVTLSPHICFPGWVKSAEIYPENKFVTIAK